MPHIHTAPGQFDLTVSAYIIRRPVIESGEAAALFHRHKSLGVMMQAGGHVEVDETPWQAIRHEVKEETGYDFDQLAVLQPCDRLTELTGDLLHPQPVCLRSFPFGDLPHFHTDLSFAFVTSQAPRQPVASGESAELIWLNREQILALGQEQTYADVRQVYLHILDRLLNQWEEVPADRFASSWAV